MRQGDDRCTGAHIGLCHDFFRVQFLFPPEVEKNFDTKIHFWGEIFFWLDCVTNYFYIMMDRRTDGQTDRLDTIFLLRQEDDRCTGTRIRLCRESFFMRPNSQRPPPKKKLKQRLRFGFFSLPRLRKIIRKNMTLKSISGGKIFFWGHRQREGRNDRRTDGQTDRWTERQTD